MCNTKPRRNGNRWTLTILDFITHLLHRCDCYRTTP